jgi:hypothetical protein
LLIILLREGNDRPSCPHATQGAAIRALRSTTSSARRSSEGRELPRADSHRHRTPRPNRADVSIPSRFPAVA